MAANEVMEEAVVMGASPMTTRRHPGVHREPIVAGRPTGVAPTHGGRPAPTEV